MPQKKHKPEEIVVKLRQVDVLVSQGQSVAEAVRSIGVTQFTYYRWRKEFGGLKSDQVKRVQDLEKERAIAAPLVRGQGRGSGCGRRSLISRSRSSSCVRLPRETSEPRPPPPLHRPCPAEVPWLGAPGLPGARPASLHTAESAARAG